MAKTLQANGGSANPHHLPLIADRSDIRCKRFFAAVHPDCPAIDAILEELLITFLHIPRGSVHIERLWNPPLCLSSGFLNSFYELFCFDGKKDDGGQGEHDRQFACAEGLCLENGIERGNIYGAELKQDRCAHTQKERLVREEPL
jgi:hypothetical protein